VKGNITLNEEWKKFLKPHILTDEEFEELNRGDLNETDQYFHFLNKFFSNDGIYFATLYDLSHIHQEFFKHKALLKNIHKQLQKKDSKITLSRLQKLAEFERIVRINGYILDSDLNPSFKITLNIDFIRIHDLVFDKTDNFISILEQEVLNCEDVDFERKTELYDDIKDLLEEYQSWECLSIDEFYSLQESIENIFGMSLKDIKI